jgi:hypothetical protein
MKPVNTLFRTAGIAAAVAGIALAAPVFGITATPNLVGTPDDGMICRSGYTGALSGSAFKCSKAKTATVELACLKPAFPNYVRRAKNPPHSDGKDLCVRNNVQVTSNGPLTGLTEGQQFVYAEVDPAAVSTAVTSLDTQEASALGLDVKEVDTVAGQAVIKIDPGQRILDEAHVPVTHYTFAIKTGVALSAATR